MALLLHPRPPTQPLRAATQHHDAIPGCTHLLCPPSHARKQRPVAVTCRVARVKEAGVSAGAPPPPQSLAKEAHKYFDHAVVTVRAGDGGHGAVLAMPPAPSADDTKRRGRFDRDKKKSKKPASYKRNYDGSVALPTGGHGGDVVVYADEAEETLLRFHEKARNCAKRGGNVGAAGGTLSSRMHNGFAGETLRIPVPVGTVVKRKKGTVLADLAHPGDEVLVARGGQGGGLPNAGKSTLLSAITLARPDIADYPFTTLMPNLGWLGGDPALGALQFSSEATLADLPCLIEGAHLGKGLGRNFLRHLRRTRVLVHIVDASADDPVSDYKIVREVISSCSIPMCYLVELRMYNPQYLERPYVVVLDKIDLPKLPFFLPCRPHDRLSSLAFEISSIGCEEGHDRNASKDNLNENINEHQVLSESEAEGGEKELGDYPRPQAVVAASVLYVS
ncbi:hypothetical protein PR202_ga13816 [Eleusine coracana subsp. coracana]|uniref:GTP-binding protein OBGC2 n=1 Tax=Eleusine coracana subsp. coracana TaxID=191504 RepID=A0AAV5CFX1_ELECO|nr:hypothetical protein PR202_ga13816 [Eleusine coracana subsp. coracana]